MALASPYYAGLTLAIVATGLLYIWPAPVVLATHTLIIASFVGLNFAFSSSSNLLTAISNQFFLVSTAIIAGTGQLLAYGTQRRQIANQLIIEQTKRNLEEAHEQLKQLDRFKSEFFRQHHARAQDAAHDDARAARALDSTGSWA